MTTPAPRGLAPLLLALLAALLPRPAHGQSGEQPGEDPDLATIHREEVAARYDFAAWPQGERRAGLANDLALPGFVATQFSAVEGFVTRDFRRADGEGATAFTLHTHVADDAAAAHAVLLTWLAGLQNPARMPDLASLGRPIGDVGFLGASGAAAGAQAWVAFVRGNVVVRLNAFDATRDPGLDLAALARRIDLALLESETVPEGVAVPRPAVSELALEGRDDAGDPIVAGAALRLAVTVQDPRAGAPRLRWIVGGSGLGYVEADAEGRPVLHTTGPGRIELALEVTGSTGTWTRSAELVLDVRDD